MLEKEWQIVIAVTVFLIVYGIISLELIHRTIIALAGAALVCLLGIMQPEDAVHAVDFNTIGLLIGMMIIVGISRQTGLFEYLAIKAARKAGGNPVIIMTYLALVTAVLSAFLDNVTTVLLIVPVTFAIAGQLNISPVPFLIAEILASNIGGTATLIGDPPNIMIGSATHLGFMDFIINLTPVVIIIHVLTVTLLVLIFRRQLTADPARMATIMAMDENKEIKDRLLLRKCLFVLTLVICGFFLHQYVNLESSVIALAGASLLMLLVRDDPEQVLAAVEWPVIFFFIGLFVLVGALEKLGLIALLAGYLLNLTGGHILATAGLILWLAAIASAFVDNIPFVATMIPMLHQMGQIGNIQGVDFDLLWWALALGACLGGNGTIIGASANVIVVGMAEKKGTIITFMSFLKVAFPLMVMSITISHIYLLFWYYFHGTVSLLATLATGILLALILAPVNRRLAGKPALTDEETIKQD